MVDKVIATPAALELIEFLKAKHGPVFFHQSGGCCDNSAANCYLPGELTIGAGVWSRNGNVAYRMGRAIKAGRVWTNCYHAYPAHAAFGGYKESGIGRETHKVMLDHYQQTKNLLVSYAEQKLGFF